MKLRTFSSSSSSSSICLTLRMIFGSQIGAFLVAFVATTFFPHAGCLLSQADPHHNTPDFKNGNLTFVSATLGRTATFKCVAKNLVGQKTVSWVRYRDVSLIAVGKFVYISDDRFRVMHEPNADDWFLVIKSVSYKDEGIYECQVNSEPYQTYKYSLSVVEPRTEIVGEHELFVDSASSLNLTCLILSPDPPAYVFWKKEGKLVEVPENSHHSSDSSQSSIGLVFDRHWKPGVTVSSLLIRKVNSSHSGTFQCIPSNSEAKTIVVHVLKDDSQPAAIHTTHQQSSSTTSKMSSNLYIQASALIVSLGNILYFVNVSSFFRKRGSS